MPSLAAMIALLLAAAPLSVIVALPAPRDDAPVLAIFPPWANRASLLEAAGARPVGPSGALLAVIVVDSSGPGRSPDLPDRLLATGAWAVRDAAAVLLACGTNS